MEMTIAPPPLGPPLHAFSPPPFGLPRLAKRWHANDGTGHAWGFLDTILDTICYRLCTYRVLGVSLGAMQLRTHASARQHCLHKHNDLHRRPLVMCFSITNKTYGSAKYNKVFSLGRKYEDDVLKRLVKWHKSVKPPPYPLFFSAYIHVHDV